MVAAEDVFSADSRAVAAQLRHLPANDIHPIAVTALGMVDIVRGFLGDLAKAMCWLLSRPVPRSSAVDRAVADQVVDLARHGWLRGITGCEMEVADAWQARAIALAAHRRSLAARPDADGVLQALLHMHHNRALGIDRDQEYACRRLARQAALAWTAQQKVPAP